MIEVSKDLFETSPDGEVALEQLQKFLRYY
jgi:hypothetical protein